METPACAGGRNPQANVVASRPSSKRRRNQPTGATRDVTEMGLFMRLTKFLQFLVTPAWHRVGNADFMREWALVGIGGSAGRFGNQRGKFFDAPQPGQDASPVDDVETGEIGVAQLQRIACRF